MAFNTDEFKSLMNMFKPPTSIKEKEAELAAQAQIQHAAAQMAQLSAQSINNILSFAGQNQIHAPQQLSPHSFCPRCLCTLTANGCQCGPMPPGTIYWRGTSVPITSPPPTFTYSSSTPRSQQWTRDKVATVEKLKSVEARRVHKPVPDSISMIVGWRGWLLKGGTARAPLRLSALGRPQITWEPKQKMVAICLVDDGSVATIGNPLALPATRCDNPPQMSCMCGMWAFKSMELLMQALNGYNGVAVVGSVNLWGRVIECENGFRAQYAYPKELWLLEGGLEELGIAYGVPIRGM